MPGNDRFGMDWSDDELNLIVADYFAMLRSELSGVEYNKSAHRRSLIQHVSRTDGSIERKHQNISAVLIELALPIISGYKPLPNFQKSIIDAIDRYLSSNPNSLKLEQPSAMGFDEMASLFAEPPPILRPTAARDAESHG